MNYFVDTINDTIVQLDAFVKIAKPKTKNNGQWAILGYTGIYTGDGFFTIFSHSDREYRDWVYTKMVQALLLDKDFIHQDGDYEAFQKKIKDCDIKETLRQMIETNNATPDEDIM